MKSIVEHTHILFHKNHLSLFSVELATRLFGENTYTVGSSNKHTGSMYQTLTYTHIYA